MNRILVVVICGIVGVLCLPVRGAHFMGLGHLSDYSSASIASDVSADGSVVVGWSGSRTLMDLTSFEAYRWTSDTGMMGLGKLHAGYGSIAQGVSADGLVVVGSSILPVNNEQGFRWTSSEGMVGLPLHTNHPSNPANATSADGSIIVGGNHNGFWFGGPRPAYRWSSADGMTEIGDLPGGGLAGSSTDVSGDGSVIVGWSITGRVPPETEYFLHMEAFRWTSREGMVGLGNLTGGHLASQATGVSPDGAVVVGYSDIAEDYSREAFRWTSTSGMVALGDLPGGNHSSYAEDVSADGSIIVGRGNSAIGEEAVLWVAADSFTPRRVADLLSEQGIDLTGWTLTKATAISADGSTIVGNGINPLGQQEAWRANIVTLPEPWGGVLLLTAMAVIALHRVTFRHLKNLSHSPGCRLVDIVYTLVGVASTSRAEIYLWDDGTLIPGTEDATPGPAR